MTAAVPVANIAQAGKYLSFKLGPEEYGLAILKVHEINSIMDITHVPRAPWYVRGVINLRGRVIPVISLREKFRLPAAADTEKTCIIVVQVDYRGESLTLGLVVDEVSEVLNVKQDQIEASPTFGGGIEGGDYIAGMGRLEDRVVILLNIDQVLDGEELASLAETVV